MTERPFAVRPSTIFDQLRTPTQTRLQQYRSMPYLGTYFLNLK